MSKKEVTIFLLLLLFPVVIGLSFTTYDNYNFKINQLRKSKTQKSEVFDTRNEKHYLCQFEQKVIPNGKPINPLKATCIVLSNP
jgi:hypothetical protein